MNRPSNTPRRVAVCLRIRVAYLGSGWTGRQNEDDDLDRPDFEGSDDAVSESDTSKQGAANAPEGIVLGPGEGRTIGGITFKATDEQTGGSIGFIEAMTPPGAGPPRHVHYSCDELFYVLGGSSSFWSGSEKLTVRPGRLSSSLGGRFTLPRL